MARKPKRELRAPKTPLQARRMAALATAGVTQAHLLDRTNALLRQAKLQPVSRETVRKTMNDAFRSERSEVVIRAFAELTGADTGVLFPRLTDVQPQPQE